jgi:hypothetical protein
MTAPTDIAPPCDAAAVSGSDRRLVLCPVTLREANDFVASFHRHNGRTARNGGKWAIGVEMADELVGVAIVGNPLSATFMDGRTAEVLRTCTREAAPKGSVSMLYSACWRAWRAMGGQRLITYTLTTESGASLRGAGWKVVAELSATNVRANWNKNRATTSRQWQPIYGQQKLRWERAENASKQTPPPMA